MIFSRTKLETYRPAIEDAFLHYVFQNAKAKNRVTAGPFAQVGTRLYLALFLEMYHVSMILQRFLLPKWLYKKKPVKFRNVLKRRETWGCLYDLVSSLEDFPLRRSADLKLSLTKANIYSPRVLHKTLAFLSFVLKSPLGLEKILQILKDQYHGKASFPF